MQKDKAMAKNYRGCCEVSIHKTISKEAVNSIRQEEIKLFHNGRLEMQEEMKSK